MANIVSAKTYLNDLEISADAPVTTQLNTRIGGAVNYLNDKTDSLQTEVDGLTSASNVVKRQIFQQTWIPASPNYVLTVPGTLAFFGCSIALTSGGAPTVNAARVSHTIMDRFTISAYTSYTTAAHYRLNLYYDSTDHSNGDAYVDITYTSSSTITFDFGQNFFWSNGPQFILQGYALYSGS